MKVLGSTDMKTAWKMAFAVLAAAVVFACLFFDFLGNERLMTYNVRNGMGMDGVTDYARAAAVIMRERPDAVAVQELDSATGRSKGIYVLGELARLTGMHATYAPAIDYDGGKYGIGMLSKEKPVRVYRHALPGRKEARMLLVAEFKEYVYACMHLSLSEEDRAASLPVIREATSGFDKPVFIAGDWNDTPGSPFVREMEKDFRILSETAAPTFPADSASETIDYIAVKRNIHVYYGSGVADVPEARVESDHRPVVVAIGNWVW